MTAMENNESKPKFKLHNYIGKVLLIYGILFILSSLFFYITDKAEDVWFDRLSSGLICLGISTIIFKIKD